MKGFFSREILELRIVALLFFSLGYYSCIKVYGHLYPYSIIWSIEESLTLKNSYR